MNSMVLVSPRVLQMSSLRSSKGNNALDSEDLDSQKGTLKGPLLLIFNTSLHRLWSLLNLQKCDTSQYGHFLLAITLLNPSFPFCIGGFFPQRVLCICSVK